jgi:hypothetical protein
MRAWRSMRRWGMSCMRLVWPRHGIRKYLHMVHQSSDVRFQLGQSILQILRAIIIR